MPLRKINRNESFFACDVAHKIYTARSPDFYFSDWYTL
ncbi:hypothetical protein [Morganella morganii IS15]|nr:hypothetical protein CSB69_1966 [Morganella morganii]EMP51608.1 hypothetical protein C790_01003 [Morganella morganii SC01]CDK66321.1 hypothetical protein [Morganella morganii IS15]